MTIDEQEIARLGEWAAKCDMSASDPAWDHFEQTVWRETGEQLQLAQRMLLMSITGEFDVQRNISAQAPKKCREGLVKRWLKR